MIRFLFRCPRFPIICLTKDILIAAETPKQLYDQIRSIELPSEEQIPVLDVTGEGWVLHIDLMVVAPLTLKKRWTKKNSLIYLIKAEPPNKQA